MQKKNKLVFSLPMCIKNFVHGNHKNKRNLVMSPNIKFLYEMFILGLERRANNKIACKHKVFHLYTYKTQNVFLNITIYYNKLMILPVLIINVNKCRAKQICPPTSIARVDEFLIIITFSGLQVFPFVCAGFVWTGLDVFFFYFSPNLIGIYEEIFKSSFDFLHDLNLARDEFFLNKHNITKIRCSKDLYLMS